MIDEELPEKDFKEIDFSALPKAQVSIGFLFGKGLYVYVKAEDNYHILCKAKLPDSLHWAVYDYIEDRCQPKYYPD